MDTFFHNIAKLYMWRKAYSDNKIKLCEGCALNEGNQLAHLEGCLCKDLDIFTLEKSLKTISHQDVDTLCCNLIRLCATLQQALEQEKDLSEVKFKDILHKTYSDIYTDEIINLCEDLVFSSKYIYTS